MHLRSGSSRVRNKAGSARACGHEDLPKTAGGLASRLGGHMTHDLLPEGSHLRHCRGLNPNRGRSARTRAEGSQSLQVRLHGRTMWKLI